MILAGTPATTELGETFFVTTALAPTIEFAPIVAPQIIVADEPIEARFFTKVSINVQSSSVCKLPSIFIDFGNLSLIKVTLCPTNTLSSI